MCCCLSLAGHPGTGMATALMLPSATGLWKSSLENHIIRSVIRNKTIPPFSWVISFMQCSSAVLKIIFYYLCYRIHNKQMVPMFDFLPKHTAPLPTPPHLHAVSIVLYCRFFSIWIEWRCTLQIKVCEHIQHEHWFLPAFSYYLLIIKDPVSLFKNAFPSSNSRSCFGKSCT